MQRPMTRRGALAHLGNLVLTATGAITLAQLTGCDGDKPKHKGNDGFVRTADAQIKGFEVKIDNQHYYVQDNYTVLDAMGNEVDTDSRKKPVRKKAVFSYLVHDKVTKLNPDGLRQEHLDLEKRIDELTKDSVIGTLVSTVIDAKSDLIEGDFFGVVKAISETLVEAHLDPKLLATGAVIHDINTSRQDYLRFISESAGEVTYERMKELYELGSVNEPVNSSSLDYLARLQNSDLKIDPEDLATFKEMQTMSSWKRRIESGKLVTRIQDRVRQSKEFSGYEAEITKKRNDWNRINEIVDSLEQTGLEREVGDPLDALVNDLKKKMKFRSGLKVDLNNGIEDGGYLKLEDVWAEEEGEGKIYFVKENDWGDEYKNLYILKQDNNRWIIYGSIDIDNPDLRQLLNKIHKHRYNKD
jgi:hypothetical protein